jgi:TRAP-type C4-dicarboxylate transport system permease small subunit
MESEKDGAWRWGKMERIYRKVCQLEWVLARITLWSMVVLIFTAAMARLLKNPINWAIDLSTCLFAWSCFLSADVAWREGKLMNVDILLKSLPWNIRRKVVLVNYLIIAAFLVYLIVFGLWLSYTTRARTFQGIPGFSYTWVTLSVPVGALLLLVTTILKVKKQLEERGNSGSRKALEFGE